ncbi:DegV family protein [[Mycoplasma] falconis]|uniref:DegV family protein n=1 Tax=[Mycoplasma] falconis TaxID=92403 RepID=A0A501XB81_9BACT|nr:DegV family protein [[Mycoplasma] falconis]TPE57554.1 DegV family protein [[Mycoplasma] falconis]
MKYKIIVDSSSGLNESQAKELGWDLLPIRCEVDNKEYQIGVDIDIDKYAEMWRANKKINALTFATPPGVAQLLVEQYQDEYDKIIIYTISNKLSSQNKNLQAQFKDNEKVFVPESNKISYLIVRDLLMFEKKIKEGKSFEEAVKHFQDNNEKLLLVPQFNDALVKGGRLSKGAAVIAKLLKIVPIIRFDNGSLEKEDIGRVFNKTLEKKVRELYEKTPTNKENIYLVVAHADNEDIAKHIEKFKEVANNYTNVVSFKLPADVSIHTGVGAVCVSFAYIDPAIKEDYFKTAKIW